MTAAYIAGNWKMNKTGQEAEDSSGRCCPRSAAKTTPKSSSARRSRRCRRWSPLTRGLAGQAGCAQKMHPAASGRRSPARCRRRDADRAATSALASCSATASGASMFGETDKAASALKVHGGDSRAAASKPILCVGETLESEREGRATPCCKHAPPGRGGGLARVRSSTGATSARW